MLKSGDLLPIPVLPDKTPGNSLPKGREIPKWRYITMRKLIPGGIGTLLASVLSMIPVVGPVLAGLVAA